MKSRPGPDSDLLQEHIDRRLEKLSEHLASANELPDQEIDRLLYLQKILDSRKKRLPKRNTWLVVFAFFSVVVITSILLFLHVPTTKVDFDVSTSGLTFSPLEQTQILSNAISVENVTLSGIERIYFPAQEAQANLDMKQPVVHIAAGQGNASKQNNRIVLERMIIAHEDTVEFKKEGNLWSCKIYNEHGSPVTSEIALNIYGKITVAGGEVVRKLFYGHPAIPYFSIHPSGIKLLFSPTEKTYGQIFEQIPIDELSFAEEVKLTDKAHPVISWRSSIRGGFLYMESLKGKKYTFRDGENLRLHLSSGTIRKTGIHEDVFRALIHGQVNELQTGETFTSHNLMPTLLEWLHAQEALGLLWFSSLYAFGLIITVIRWWKGSQHA